MIDERNQNQIRMTTESGGNVNPQALTPGTPKFKPGFRAFLHRFLPGIKATPVQRLSLWVSRMDGSGMQEVGGIEVESNPNTSAGMPRGAAGAARTSGTVFNPRRVAGGGVRTNSP